VLDLLSRSSVPAPRVVAADPEAAVCDVPTLLLTRLPGRPPGLPRDMGTFLAQLAEALPPIHAIDGGVRGRISPYRNHHDLRSLVTPSWSRRPKIWQRAFELARAGPPTGPHCLIHRDYHPENTLWVRGRLLGIVDWTSASWGPQAVDTAHMRWNLALTYGIDAADHFLSLHRAIVSNAFPDQHYWDVVTVLDLVFDLVPDDWPAFDLERLERYLESVLRRAA
jgi:aminoglycoside phosphotransferase (APT) family kinase protein